MVTSTPLSARLRIFDGADMPLAWLYATGKNRPESDLRSDSNHGYAILSIPQIRCSLCTIRSGNVESARGLAHSNTDSCTSKSYARRIWAQENRDNSRSDWHPLTRSQVGWDQFPRVAWAHILASSG